MAKKKSDKSSNMKKGKTQTRISIRFESTDLPLHDIAAAMSDVFGKLSYFEMDEYVEGQGRW